MKITVKTIFLFILVILVLFSGGFMINKYIIEKYKTLRTVGLFPLKFNRIVNGRENDIQNNDDKKYTRHHYNKYRRRFNFLSQRNIGIRQ